MSIKLKGLTNGSIELDVPDAVGSDLQVTLPATAGEVVVKAANGSVDLGAINVDSSGKVGIGTSAPSSQLDVRGSATDFDGLRILNTNSGSGVQTSAAIRLGITNSFGAVNGIRNCRIQATENNTDANEVHLDFYTNSAVGLDQETVKMRLTSGGNVGIGTTAPGSFNSSFNNLVVGSGSGNKGITVYTGNVDSGFLAFNDIADTSVRGLIEYNHNGDYMGLRTNGSERLRIDSSGKVGIGTSSPDQRLHIHENSTGACLTRYTNSVTGSASGDGMVVGLDSTEDGLVMVDEAKNLILGTNGAGRMRIDSSGRVGIGTASPSTKLHLSTTGTDGFRLGIDGQTYYHLIRPNGDGLYIGADDGNTGGSGADIRFNVKGSEKVRIDNAGNVGIGISNPSAGASTSNGVSFRPGNADVWFNHSAGAASVYTFFAYNGTSIGSIGRIGTTAVSYNTTSDYRLKENIVDLSEAITRVKQLQPKRFNFIADSDTNVDGFIAHEAQIVVPEAVTGTHNEVDDDGNAVMQGIDQSKLVPLLTAALQEAIAKIETLETKVAALEATS